MSYADRYLATLRLWEDDAFDRDRDRAVLELVSACSEAARAERLARDVSIPGMGAIIRFYARSWPGDSAEEDADWAVDAALARRELAIHRLTGMTSPVDRSWSDLFDWVEDHLGSWEPAEFETRIRSRIDAHLNAGRRGRERGIVMAMYRAGHATPQMTCAECWALRHPLDHRLHRARAVAEDPRLGEILDTLISELSGCHDALRADHLPHDHADLVVELSVLEPVSPGWTEPVPTVISAVHEGDAVLGDHRGLRLVRDPTARFNGTLIAPLAGERWLLHAEALDDGTLVPLDGSRRLAA